MDYLDFELRVGPGTGREYPISVLRSPAGEAVAVMRFPFDTLALANHLQALEIAVLRSSGTRRDIVRADEPQPVVDFGRQLFECLMTDAVRESFRRSQDRARAGGKGLRVRLRIEDPALAALPWEYLYDEAEGDYVCLSSDTPVVRYMESERAPEALAVQPPLHILGVVASPSDRPALDVAHERQRVATATQAMRDAGQLQITWLDGSTWRDLQRAMRRGPYHILHFVGHGGFDAAAGEGVVALTDDAGASAMLTATQLGRLLADHESLRLVVLNSCLGARGSGTDVFSSTASMLIRRGVPAVVAMQYEISDRAAVEFARSLYEALADGMPIDAAVAEARKAISFAASGTVEWGTPVLHMRSPDGILFRIDTSASATRRAARAPAPIVVTPPPAPLPPPGPALAEQVRGLRGRLLMAAGPQDLQALVYEADALRAAHPLDVELRMLHDQLSAARQASEQPPADDAFRARAPGRRSSRWLGGGLSTLTAAALLFMVMRDTPAGSYADVGTNAMDTTSMPADMGGSAVGGVAPPPPASEPAFVPPPPPPPPAAASPASAPPVATSSPGVVQPAPVAATRARRGPASVVTGARPAPREPIGNAPVVVRRVPPVMADAPVLAGGAVQFARTMTAEADAAPTFWPARSRVGGVTFVALGDGGWELRMQLEREVVARPLRNTITCRLRAGEAEARSVVVPVAFAVGERAGEFGGRFDVARPWAVGRHPVSCRAALPEGDVLAWAGHVIVR